MNEDNCGVKKIRNVSDVESVIQLAKLETSELLPNTQVVEFSNHLIDQGVIKILEIPNQLADDLAGGASLTIRGDGNDSAVLCSKDKTFDVKEAETSNSLLLVDKIRFPGESQSLHETPSSQTNQGDKIEKERVLYPSHITGILYRYLELKECRPRLAKLRSILSGTEKCGNKEICLYSGVQSIHEEKSASFQDLLDTIQCSEVELMNGLKKLKAITVPVPRESTYSHIPSKVIESWFMIDIGYHMRVLSLICNYVEEMGWNWDCHEIDREKVINTLKEIEPDYVISQIFGFYFYSLPDNGSQGDQLPLDQNHSRDKNAVGYKANKELICKFYGEFLLETNPKYQLPEFLQIWQKAVPGGEDPDISSNASNDPVFKIHVDQLKGIALVDREQDEIKRFPEWILPVDVQERLRVLFNEREKWTLEDISPYIENLTTSKLNVNGLLTKYSKVTIGKNGNKIFCAKHGK